MPCLQSADKNVTDAQSRNQGLEGQSVGYSVIVTRYFCFLVESLNPRRGMFNCCLYLKDEES